MTNIDYGKASADALNVWSPERTASYRKWLEFIGPRSWTPVAKADMEKMLAEEKVALALGT